MPELVNEGDRVALEKLTKAEIIDRLLASETRAARMEDALHARRNEIPTGAAIITALVDLHRATAESGDGRYLKAARQIGDDIARSILGDEGDAR